MTVISWTLFLNLDSQTIEAMNLPTYFERLPETMPYLGTGHGAHLDPLAHAFLLKGPDKIVRKRR